MIKYCNFCGGTFNSFLPLKNHVTSEFLSQVDGVGSDVNNYQCPLCGVNDRERHLKLYLEASGILSTFYDSSVLHFSPEMGLLALIQGQRPRLHILAQFESADARFQPIDIEKIPYSSESFDFVIANHVLEHVNSPQEALKEINRVLRPGGMAILQTPFSNLLSKTFEDQAITSERQREYFFGQADHLRLFGRDLFTLLSSELTSKLIQHSDLFSEDVALKYGVNSKEPFFLFEKKSSELTQQSSVSKAAKCDPCDNGPKVTVIVATYNHQNYLNEALDSILAQACNFEYEVIIVDDCSTDETLKVARDYWIRNPDRIRILESTENNGPFRNGRRAFPLARGKYIALLDGDDYWLDPKKLEKQTAYLDHHPECVITFASIQAAIDGKIIFDHIGGVKRDLASDELILTAPINTSTVMFRKVFSTLPDLGPGFTPDLLLWSMLGHYGSGHYHRDILPTRYRIHKYGYHGNRTLADRIQMRLQTFIYLADLHITSGNEHLARAFIGNIISDMAQLRKLRSGEREEVVLNSIESDANSVFAPSAGLVELLRLIWGQICLLSDPVELGAGCTLSKTDSLAIAGN